MELILNVTHKDGMIYNFIPKALKSYIITEYNKNVKRYLNLEDYILKEYKIKDNIKTILLTAINNLYIDSSLGYYILKINDSLKYKDTNYKLTQLVRLIDYGGVNVRGTHLFVNAVNYIKSNFRALSVMYSISRRGEE